MGIKGRVTYRDIENKLMVTKWEVGEEQITFSGNLINSDFFTPSSSKAQLNGAKHTHTGYI